MSTKVEKSIEVAVPVSTAYNQWTQFEEFPQFMGGVSQVTQLDDKTLHWVAEIAGVKREWDAAILEQVPDSKVSWAATSGATNAGAVEFQSLGADRTSVSLTLEYEPEGLVEQVGDKLGIVQKQVTSDLEKFKKLIESRGFESGGWRGEVAGAGGTPGVEHAAASQGDSGKAGISGKAVAAGVAAVAAVGVAAAAATKSGSSDDDVQPVETAPVTTLEPTPVETVPVDTTPVETVPVGTTPLATETSLDAAPLDTAYPVAEPDPAYRAGNDDKADGVGRDPLR